MSPGRKKKNFDTNLKIITLYFFDDVHKQFELFRIWGRVLATKMCFVLEYLSQGANDAKQQASFSLHIDTEI